jgi:hypothetical protein
LSIFKNSPETFLEAENFALIWSTGFREEFEMIFGSKWT